MKRLFCHSDAIFASFSSDALRRQWPIPAGLDCRCNANALIDAAEPVFAQYGYSPGPVNCPDSMSLDKPAGGFGKLLYGSYDQTTTFRVQLSMIQVPGTNNFQLRTRVSRVSDPGRRVLKTAQR